MTPDDLAKTYAAERYFLGTADGPDLSKLVDYFRSKADSSEAVNVPKLVVYDKHGDTIRRDTYNCHSSTSEYRYLKFGDTRVKLPTKLSDTHGHAPVCDRCPHQLHCASGEVAIIEVKDFPDAEQVIVTVAVDPAFGNPFPDPSQPSIRRVKNGDIWFAI